jgi:hypothetical protein
MFNSTGYEPNAARDTKFKKLNGSNFFTWKICAKAKLTTVKSWKCFKAPFNDKEPTKEREIALAQLDGLIDESQFELLAENECPYQS